MWEVMSMERLMCVELGERGGEVWVEVCVCVCGGEGLRLYYWKSVERCRQLLS